MNYRFGSLVVGFLPNIHLLSIPVINIYCIRWCIRRTPVSAGQIKKKEITNIKHDEIIIMNIINDNIFKLHNSLLNNDNRYGKVTLKTKLIEVARKLISADYHKF